MGPNGLMIGLRAVLQIIPPVKSRGLWAWRSPLTSSPKPQHSAHLVTAFRWCVQQMFSRTPSLSLYLVLQAWIRCFRVQCESHLWV